MIIYQSLSIRVFFSLEGTDFFRAIHALIVSKLMFENRKMKTGGKLSFNLNLIPCSCKIKGF